MDGAARTAPAGIDPVVAAGAAGLTVADLFAQRARLDAGRVALEEGARAWTYAELDARASQLANALAARGVGRGDRVAILSENRAEYIELLLACARLACIAACQNWRMADGELRHCLGLVEPALIVASPRFAQTAGALAAELPGAPEVLELGEAYEAALAAQSEQPPAVRPHPEDGLVILYTSGTTGLPKGALISQRAEVARAMVAASDLPTTPEDGFVAWAPLFHMASTDTSLATLMNGGKVIVMDGYEPDALAEVVAKERIGRLTLMPGMIGGFIEAMKRQGKPAKGVKYCGVMADLVPREQLVEITTLLDAPYLNTFGATETGSTPASRGRIPVGQVPVRLDKSQNSWCLVKLVDEEDREVPDGEPGEMCVRGPTLFSGYWNNPETNAKDFRGGWFHMGDVFTRNPDGTLSFVDRRKYLIKSGGENIYPAEIERVLLAFPGVVDAIVVRREDAKWGEVPVAFVVRRDDSVTEEALVEACRGEIARYKIPKAVRFVEDAELPRSVTGKIKRQDLEARLKQERA